jgi:hypothetical protein
VDGGRADLLSGKGSVERARAMSGMSFESQGKNGTPGASTNGGGLRRMWGNDDCTLRAPKWKSRLLLAMLRQDASRPRGRRDLSR